MRLCLAATNLLMISLVAGFSVAPRTPFRHALTTQQPQQRLPAAMVVGPLKSEPSDTSSDSMDDFIIVDSKDYDPTVSEEWVTRIMDLIPTKLGQQVSSETRASINEGLIRLEALNPTPKPAQSPLLNGVWELRYAGGYTTEWALPSPTRDLALFVYSGGYSPGIFALTLAQKLPSGLVEVGDLEISIRRSQPRVEASVDVKLFGSAPSAVKVQVALQVESDVRLRETYERATILDRAIDIPQNLQYQRELYVTFLDNDLLVVRDASGVPEVLVRKEKKFQQNWGTEPSDLDDMVPPGEM